MYFDCHTHIFPPRRLAGLMRWIHRAGHDHGVPVDITPDDAVGDLRRAGAARWMNLLFPLEAGEAAELHVWGAELAERVPEITPIGGVHVDDPDPLAVVQEAVEGHGMAGLKFHPMVQRFVPWDTRLAGALDYVEARELPIYVHTGYDEWYGWRLPREGFEEMLDRRPRLPVVVPHIGFPDLEWGFGLADRFPQVYLDLTNVPGSVMFDPEGWERALATFRRGVSRHRDRVLMGTDYPAGMGSLEQIFAQLEAAELGADLLEHVMLVSTRGFFDRFGRPRP